ncbi:methionyl-tRNA formyltransferase [Fibrella sp. WM1]|uniref:methionyl-tRNA formyltransferase n=1 Tax=Fibrella musci TaxID=3242485 RepID=UPI00351F8E59
MNEKLRLVFMGTPDFAVASLQALLEGGCNVVAVITAPDRPSGRGQQLTPSPVKKAALAAGLPVLQPEKLRDPAFLAELANYQADLQVVVAFRMLPEVVWSMPSVGTFNLHGSKLPDYRGAAPINWAIIRGETETGVTTFFIEKEIDTGQMIFQETEPIHPDDNAGTLHDRLMVRGAALVLRTVQAIEAGTYPRTPQPEPGDEKSAPKLNRENTEIDWNQPVGTLRNFIRGLSPYPTAWTTINGRFYKIYATDVANGMPPNGTPPDGSPMVAEPGQAYTDGKTNLLVKAADGWISITELQAEGKRRMAIGDYLRGNSI